MNPGCCVRRRRRRSRLTVQSTETEDARTEDGKSRIRKELCKVTSKFSALPATEIKQTHVVVVSPSDH